MIRSTVMFPSLTISHSLQLLHFISSLGDRSRIIPSLRCPSMVSWASLALYFAGCEVDAQRHWECYRVTGSSKKQPFCIQSSCVFHLWNAAGFYLSDARSTCRMRMKISWATPPSPWPLLSRDIRQLDAKVSTRIGIFHVTVIP